MIRPKSAIPQLPRPAARRGFTLLELLLAVSITGIISIVLFTSLSMAFDMRRQGERKLSDRNAARLAVDLLAKDLACAPPLAGAMTREFVGEDEVGPETLASDVLTFVTANAALPTDQELGDLREVQWQLVDDPAIEGQLQLVRLVTTNLLAPVTPIPTQQVIARRVLSLNIRYDDGSDWIDAWNSADRENTLPRAIEITLVVQPEHQARHTSSRQNEDDEPDTLTIRRIVLLPTSTTSGTAGPGSRN